MKALPLFAIIYCGGVLLITASAPQGPWTIGQQIWINWGGLSLMALFAYSIFAATIEQLPEKYRFAFAAIVVMVLGTAWAYRGEITDKVVELVVDTTRVAAVADTQPTAALARRWDGHFRAKAAINDGTVEMLVDTGASVVLLRFEDAVSAGVDMSDLVFNVPILTANGKSHVAAITLDEVSIGGVLVSGVEAAVAEPGQLHASLLGMSFLGEIEEAVIRKDRLILRN